MHPAPECVDLAERRRAFPRALRVPGPLDVTPLREHLHSSTSTSPTHPDREQVETRMSTR